MNPFDLRAALQAKHAQHVVLIHFPIALFIGGVAFDLIARWSRNRALAAAAYYNLLFAALSTIPVVVTGLVAWQWQLAAQRLKGALLLHLMLGIISSMLIWLVWWIHFRARRADELELPVYRLPLEILGVAFVGMTGHLGGILSGVNLSS